jgi:hypothetical protein
MGMYKPNIPHPPDDIDTTLNHHLFLSKYRHPRPPIDAPSPHKKFLALKTLNLRYISIPTAPMLLLSLSTVHQKFN